MMEIKKVLALINVILYIVMIFTILLFTLSFMFLHSNIIYI